MTYQHPDTALLIFCKAPVPGLVKTRLMPFLSAEQAAELHIKLTRRILQLLTQQNICPVQLWCSPSAEHPFFRDCVKMFNLTLHAQQGSTSDHVERSVSFADEVEADGFGAGAGAAVDIARGLVGAAQARR